MRVCRSGSETPQVNRQPMQSNLHIPHRAGAAATRACTETTAFKRSRAMMSASGMAIVAVAVGFHWLAGASFAGSRRADKAEADYTAFAANAMFQAAGGFILKSMLN